jgi:hypothetical protein
VLDLIPIPHDLKREVRVRELRIRIRIQKGEKKSGKGTLEELGRNARVSPLRDNHPNRAQINNPVLQPQALALQDFHLGQGRIADEKKKKHGGEGECSHHPLSREREIEIEKTIQGSCQESGTNWRDFRLCPEHRNFTGKWPNLSLPRCESSGTFYIKIMQTF